MYTYIVYIFFAPADEREQSPLMMMMMMSDSLAVCLNVSFLFCCRRAEDYLHFMQICREKAAIPPPAPTPCSLLIYSFTFLRFFKPICSGHSFLFPFATSFRSSIPKRVV